jgi:hypothetical protein
VLGCWAEIEQLVFTVTATCWRLLLLLLLHCRLLATACLCRRQHIRAIIACPGCR